MLDNFDDPVFIALVESIERYFSEVIDHGSDHELFIASYLHGHFSVALSLVEEDAKSPIVSLQKLMTNSLHMAFEQNELEAQEQAEVSALWQTLCRAAN